MTQTGSTIAEREAEARAAALDALAQAANGQMVGSLPADRIEAAKALLTATSDVDGDVQIIG